MLITHLRRFIPLTFYPNGSLFDFMGEDGWGELLGKAFLFY
jgi:hypothetical protein